MNLKNVFPEKRNNKREERTKLYKVRHELLQFSKLLHEVAYNIQVNDKKLTLKKTIPNAVF